MPETWILGDRRQKPRPSPETIARAVIIAALIAFLAWAAKPLVPVSESRFEADSARHDRENARRDSTLNRIDSRVGAIYCASLPTDKQPGCR